MTPSDKEEIFQRHYLRFWAQPGDYVAFKKGKGKKSIKWKVVHIEKDPDKVTWTNEGLTPNYIQLEAEIMDRHSVVTKTTVWTCENKLLVTHRTKE